MPVISVGSINIPTAHAATMKAASLAILDDRQPLDDTLPSIPSTDPTTWTNKQLLQYHLVWGPSLMELMRQPLASADAAVVAAEADSATKQTTFDTAKATHNAATATLDSARDTARDTADAVVTAFVLT